MPLAAVAGGAGAVNPKCATMCTIMPPEVLARCRPCALTCGCHSDTECPYSLRVTVR